jgi:NAD(P)-dependent dehydrogenase (short-subunit alcohol dehydrogenase family)
VSRTLVVTGASRGIGRALVAHLRAAGHRAIATCRGTDAVDALASEGIDAVQLDTTDPASLDTVADRLGAEVDHIDVLVNNAGIKWSPDHPWEASAGPMGTIVPAAVADILATNVVGTLATTQALLPLLLPGGIVANISSQLGSLSEGVGVDYSYNSSKAALNMTTVTMQRDLGPRGGTAVAVNPGWMRTAMGGDDAPLDVAAATADLAALLARLDASFGGRFVDRHGEPFPW